MTEVRCEIADGRIAIRSTNRFPGDLDMSRSIPGGRWSPEKKYWHYPLTLTTCQILRTTYTDMLVIGPELTAWARQEKARVAHGAELWASSEAPLTRVPDAAPDLYAALASRPYQTVGARFIADYRQVLLADEPTLGKTVQYLGGVAEAGLDHGMHLVVGPKSSLYSTWAEEIHKWTDWHAFWMPDGRARRERMLDLFMADEYEGPRFLVINFEMLQIKIEQWCAKCLQFDATKEWYKKQATGTIWFPEEHYYEGHKTKPKISKCDWPELFEIEWQSICIDEAHMSLLGIRPGGKATQQGNGLVRLRSAEGGVRIGATGTPLRGRALNFWSAFNWLRPDLYGSKWAWAQSFLEITDNGFGKTIGDVLPHREEMLNDSLKTIMLRRTKKEVQPELPDDQYIDHWVEMPERHRKQYEEIVATGELEMEGGALSTKGVLAEHTRRKQFAFGEMEQVGQDILPRLGGSPKIALLIKLLEKRGVVADEFRLDGGWKYIIGSQYTRVLKSVAAELEDNDIRVMMLTGDVTTKKRGEVIDSFRFDPDGPRLLLINTHAGGTSLTLDDMCDEMFIVDETWVADEQFQLEGRIRNRQIEKRVAVRSYHYIRTRGTIEEEIAESGLSQDDFQKRLLDRSRGVNNTKKRRTA